jgi:hypothetical protein
MFFSLEALRKAALASAIASTVGAAACGTLIGASGIEIVDGFDANDDLGRAPAEEDGAIEARPGDAGADVAVVDAEGFVAPPNAACLLPEVSRAGFVFYTEPAQPHTGVLEIYAHDPVVPHTNVGIRVCTSQHPLPVDNFSATSIGDASHYTWRFAPMALPSGQVQIAFRADPDAQVYATARIVVLP